MIFGKESIFFESQVSFRSANDESCHFVMISMHFISNSSFGMGNNCLKLSMRECIFLGCVCATPKEITGEEAAKTDGFFLLLERQSVFVVDAG